MTGPAAGDSGANHLAGSDPARPRILDERTGRVFTGIHATRKVGLQVPLLVLPVGMAAPLAAVCIAWQVKPKRGAGLFALSMVGAFLFGYLLHLVIDSPDLHSNGVGKHEDLFFHSALALAVSEFTGFVLGVHVRLARDSGA